MLNVLVATPFAAMCEQTLDTTLLERRGPHAEMAIIAAAFTTAAF
jgi:hypothetical protein